MPTITIFGGTFASISKPLGDKAIAIEPTDRYGCLKPCHLSKCVKPNKCINTIEPTVIAEHIKTILPNAVKDIKINDIIFKGRYNQDKYIGMAPIFACNYSCKYCISNMNRENFLKYEMLPVEKWIEIAKNVSRENPGIPISLGTAEQYRDWETDRKSTRLNSSHSAKSRMPSSA